MEWQSPGSPEGNSVDKVRCITAGMGSSVQWHQDRRTLEPGRAGNTYKLLGAVGSTLGSAVLLEGSHSSVSTATVRQPDSCSMHHQLGGGQFPRC